MRFAVAGDQQVAVARIIEVGDPDRTHRVHQSVEVHSVLGGVGLFLSDRAVPLDARDGAVGLPKQQESLVACVRVGLGG